MKHQTKSSRTSLATSPGRHLLRCHPSIRYLLYQGEVDALECRALFPTSTVCCLISPCSPGFAHSFLECQMGQLQCPFLSLFSRWSIHVWGNWIRAQRSGFGPTGWEAMQPHRNSVHSSKNIFFVLLLFLILSLNAQSILVNKCQTSFEWPKKEKKLVCFCDNLLYMHLNLYKQLLSAVFFFHL